MLLILEAPTVPPLFSGVLKGGESNREGYLWHFGEPRRALGLGVLGSLKLPAPLGRSSHKDSITHLQLWVSGSLDRCCKKNPEARGCASWSAQDQKLTYVPLEPREGEPSLPHKPHKSNGTQWSLIGLIGLPWLPFPIGSNGLFDPPTPESPCRLPADRNGLRVRVPRHKTQAQSTIV